MSGQEEIAGALRGFGFTGKEVYDAIKHVKKADQEIAETIKLALRYLGKWTKQKLKLKLVVFS